MNSKQLFEDIYFECNLKPLFEQVLREMGNFTPKSVWKKFYDALQKARERISNNFGTKDRRNTNTTYNRNNDDQHLELAVNETIDAGKGTVENNPQPFRMRIDNNIITNHTDNPDLANNFVVDLEAKGNPELKNEFRNSIEGWICALLLLLPKDSNNEELYKIKGFSLKSIFEMWKKCYDEILNP